MKSVIDSGVVIFTHRIVGGEKAGEVRGFVVIDHANVGVGVTEFGEELDAEVAGDELAVASVPDNRVEVVVLEASLESLPTRTAGFGVFANSLVARVGVEFGNGKLLNLDLGGGFGGFVGCLLS